MKIFHRAVTALGALTVVFLFCRLGPGRVLAHIRDFGLIGFLAVLPLQAIDQCVNSLAWSFTFAPDDARKIPFFSLFKGRLAGDGVNYLTPSATVAGEFVRPGILGPVLPEEVKNASVAVGKLSQTLGQIAFILVGILFMVLGRLSALDGRELFSIVTGASFVGGLIVFSLWILTARKGNDGFFWDVGGPLVKNIREGMRRYMAAHPARLVFSVVLFTAGYACGMIEVAVICSFMGLPLDALKALVIEALSNAFEGLFFMVPAKLGTQEAGKVLIFEALGYTAGQGLSFAVIRHIRELLWSSAGFAIYAFGKNRSRSDRSQAFLRPLERAGLSGPRAP